MTSQIVERRDANEHHLLPDEVIDLHIGKRIRRRRRLMGITLEMLAGATGVRFQQIQKYEKGVNRVAASRLFDIAAALDMPVARFFEGLIGGRAAAGVAEPKETYASDVLTTPEGAQLVALFASIESPRVRRRVVELVRALAEDAAEAGKRG